MNCIFVEPVGYIHGFFTHLIESSMKKLIFFLFLSLVVIEGYSQVWKKNLPQDKLQQGTVSFYDIQKAFNEYWQPYQVEQGYYVSAEGKRVKATGWKQFKRWEWYWENRVDRKTGEFPKTTAWEELQKSLKDNPSGVNSTSGNWTSAGPSSSPGGYAGLGRINCVAFHPTDNNTIYAGSASGGMWKTSNGGASWSVLTDNLPVMGLSDICVNTANPDIIYIATGDKDGGSVWSLGGGQSNDNRSVGVMKSFDGGESWNTTGLIFQLSDNDIVYRLLMNPSDNNMLYAATSAGLYQTTDAGITWNNIYSAVRFCDLEFKPGTPGTVYGSTLSGDIYRSVDGGSVWSSRLTTSYARVEIAVSPANADIVYAIMEDPSPSESPVYKSTNGGTTFTRVFNSGTVSLLGYECDGSDMNGSQASYDLTIAADPTNANIVYVGGINVWKSTNGGSAWSINTHWSGTCSGTATNMHADQHYFAYQPGTNDLFLGNDGGLYKTTNSGSSWSYIGSGMVNSQLYRLGVSQTGTGEVICGLQDNGTKSLSGGIWEDVKGGDGMECLIDFSNANIQYGTYVEGQITRTSNHWGSSTDIEPAAAGPGAWVTPFIIDPVNNQTLYAGYTDVWKTTNSGTSWTQISTINSPDKIRSMAISASNNQILYVADPVTIWKTTNGGTSWSDITTGLPVAYCNITYISVKADDPQTVWVSLGGYNALKVFQTTNGGTTWSDISGGLPSIPVMCVIQNKLVTNRIELYAATDVGVYFKKGSSNWQLFSSGLPNVLTTELEIYYAPVPENSKIYVATFGRGLWKSDLYNDGTAPTNLAASPVSSSQVHLSWVNNINNDPVVVAFNTTNTFGSPVNGSNYNAGNTIPGGGTVIFNGSATSFDHTSLLENTTYFYKVWAMQTGTVYSTGITASITTPCGTIASFPFAENFENTTFPPACWAKFRGTNNLGTAQDWVRSTTNTYNASSGAAFVQYENVTGGLAEDWLVTPKISLPATGTSTLTFYERQDYSQDYGSLYYVKVSTSSQMENASFVEVTSYNEATFGTTYTSRTIDLTPFNGQSIYIAFVMTNDDGDSWYVDNVTIDHLAPVIPQSYDVTGQIPSSFYCFNASENLYVSNFIIDAGGSAELISGNHIVFTPFVYINEGAYLWAHITTNSQYCGDQPQPGTIGSGDGIRTDVFLSEGRSSLHFNIYPNPTSGIFHLELKDLHDYLPVRVEIYNQVGKIVLQAQFSDRQKYSLDLSDSPAGIYLVRLIHGNESEVAKLIRQ